MNNRLNGFLWGNVSGAAVALVFGLYIGWIVTGKQAGEMANNRAHAAVTAAMAPVCVERFKRADGYATKLAALKRIDVPWKRRDFVVEGDWADVGKDANYAVADACADALNKL
jgi:hypothetical protein